MCVFFLVNVPVLLKSTVLIVMTVFIMTCDCDRRLQREVSGRWPGPGTGRTLQEEDGQDWQSLSEDLLAKWSDRKSYERSMVLCFSLEKIK